MEGNSTLTPQIYNYILLTFGIIMGIFYGFDGWRGSKTGELKDSPRLKQFRWVAIGGFLALIGDFKFFEPNIKKADMFGFYIAGFTISAVLTITCWTIVIALNLRRLKKNSPHLYPPPPFTPIFDYLRYGYEYYRNSYQDRIEKISESALIQHKVFIRNFIPIYVRQIIFATGAVNHFKSNPSEALKNSLAIQLLRCLCAVVTAYHRNLAGEQVNANIMLYLHKNELPQGMVNLVRFHWGDFQRYEGFLVLREYAEDINKQSFILPIESKADKTARNRVLPGAPEAYFKGETVRIDDTTKMTYAKAIPKNICQAIQQYFANQQFRSFVSMIIRDSQGNHIGIVNIDSNQLNIFGNSADEKKEIETLLIPFVNLLGDVIAH